MKFEYKITKHSASEISSIVYFCSDKGDCRYDQIPTGQIEKMEEILNREGADGWELVQLAFGEDGVVVIWKKSR